MSLLTTFQVQLQSKYLFPVYYYDSVMSIYKSEFLSGNVLRGEGQNLVLKNVWGASQKHCRIFHIYAHNSHAVI